MAPHCKKANSVEIIKITKCAERLKLRLTIRGVQGEEGKWICRREARRRGQKRRQRQGQGRKGGMEKETKVRWDRNAKQ